MTAAAVEAGAAPDLRDPAGPWSADGKTGSPGLERREAPDPSVSGRAFTALCKVKDGREAELSAYLTGIGKDIDASSDIVFSRLRLVHFMRWVIVRDTSGAPWLAFESNHDGELSEHLAELWAHGAVALRRIYRHCEGSPFDAGAGGGETPEGPAALGSFLASHALPSAAFHVGVHRKSAERIRREAAIHDALEAFLDRRSGTSGPLANDLDALYGELLRHLDAERLGEWARERQPPPPPSADLPWILRALPAALLILPASPLLFFLLWRHESTERADEPTPVPPGIRELADREDFQVQNQLTHIVDIRPGWFRQLSLRLVLFAIDLLARYKFNQGALGGITTIHFARWVIIDGGKRLLFFSNYDGSWESYLGDFIDKAHAGLTAVWSNTEGFPKTAHLVSGGATDEERFKSWTRSHQVPTELWYSAYPKLTVRNIQRNARICAGLADKPRSRRAMLAWLEGL